MLCAKHEASQFELAKDGTRAWAMVDASNVTFFGGQTVQLSSSLRCVKQRKLTYARRRRP